MHPWAVIALRIILEDQLPIGADIILNPLGRAQLRKVPMRKFSGQRRKDFIQRSRRLCQTNEYKTLPQREAHRVQRMVSLFKIRHAVHVGRAEQSSIETVGPGMIRTLNRRRMPARVLAQTRPTVAAYVVESVHRALLVTDND